MYITMNLGEFKQTFDPYLKLILEARIAESLKGKGDLSFAEIWRYPLVLAASGKRLRPYLAYLGYSAVGGTSEEEIMRVGAGLELFHTFCLIHDDIMDQDLDRRGVATTHVYAADWLKGNVLEETRTRIAESLALLLGDAMFEWARELLGDARIQQRLRYMIDEVILGQGIDCLLAGNSDASREDLDHMMTLKTAGYSFVRPLQIGGAVAGMDTGLEQFFSEFGTALGLAFQLQDDYFDREKDTLKDRPTYYTRGHEKEGLALVEEKFTLAETLLRDSVLQEKIKKMFAALVQKIRERKE